MLPRPTWTSPRLPGLPCTAVRLWAALSRRRGCPALRSHAQPCGAALEYVTLVWGRRCSASASGCAIRCIRASTTTSSPASWRTSSRPHCAQPFASAHAPRTHSEFRNLSDGLARSWLLRAGDGAIPLKHRRNAAHRSVAASQHATNRRCGSRVATRRPHSIAAPLARGGRRIVGARTHCRYPALAASWALSRALVVRVARNVTVEKGFEPYPGTGTTLSALAS